MNLAGQGSWVRRYMEEQHGIRQFTLVNSHWHADHIAENHVYADGNIIAHEDTRRLMLEHRDKLENGERASVPPFNVVLPNITFKGRLDLWCGKAKVELHEFTIHEHGHIASYLPEQKTLLAADMLEDPIWIFEFDFAPPSIQVAELKRMADMDLEHIYPTHGDLDTIRHGGYGKEFVRNSIDYLERMIAASKSQTETFADLPASEFIADKLNAGELHWWQPYEEVHAINKRTILSLALQSAARETES